jgi:tetratricopeptide (TPR) repeat protein
VLSADEDVELAESFKNVGIALKALGKYTEAVDYLKQSYEAYKAFLHDDIESVAEQDAALRQLLKSIVECYYKTSDMVNAALYQKKLYNFERRNYSLACVIS